MKGVKKRPPPGGWSADNPAPRPGYRARKEGRVSVDDPLPPLEAQLRGLLKYLKPRSQHEQDICDEIGGNYGRKR
jgi:hypothetical protein